MTDYFALLDQPRSPWLDPEQLKQVFHARSLQTHPDAQPDSGTRDDGTFTRLNDAYRVLREPRLRLQHLLALAGETPADRSAAIPPDLGELFSSVASLMRRVSVVLEKGTRATNALSASLGRSELWETQEGLDALLGKLEQLRESADERAKALGERWQSDRGGIAELRELYLRFSYLTRWIDELKEKQLQLSAE